MIDMIKLDMHIHSKYSDDGLGTPNEIIKSLQNKGINGMSITDHNTLKGSLNALSIAPKDFLVITGMEISTKDGHLLAYNIKKEIPKNLPVEETVDKIIDSGGIAVPPHLYRNMSGIKEKKLNKLLGKISTIEVFNSCSVPQSNLKTSMLAKKIGFGGTGGSDSHMPNYAGYAFTVVDIQEPNRDEVIEQIIKKKTWGKGKTLPIEYRRDRMIKSINQFFTRGFKRI
jgi:predicted metal-dependent phosphoesterase TrpH